ncbi:hypothetical protein DYB32_006157 [Aphanomyces invadans]|uniref:Thioredoxin domain-containing protein n=1 Tax=Aphanomyces invadans TaxID=157072 RepID=A0A3R6VJW2_9STRA|nr:hypothetical protein DYB32_006157 [Aphanomyces invadans]
MISILGCATSAAQEVIELNTDSFEKATGALDGDSREFHKSNSNAMVVTLTTDTFDDLTEATSSNAGVWLVDFYAPWCKHCKTLTPMFEELAPLLDAEKIHVGMVDANEHVSLRSRFRIKTYPTVMVFAQGKMYKFRGSRTVQDLMAFAQGGYLSSDVDGSAVPPPVKLFDPSQSHVVELVPETFDAVTQVETGGDWFILFHTANCGPCGEVLLEWDQVSVDLLGRLHVGSFKLKPDILGAWSKRFGLFGFPSLVVFSKGRMYRSYRGNRSAPNLVEYALQQLQAGQRNSIPVPGPNSAAPMQFHSPLPLKRVAIESVDEEVEGDAGNSPNEKIEKSGGNDNDDDVETTDDDGDAGEKLNELESVEQHVCGQSQDVCQARMAKSDSDIKVPREHEYE